MKILIAAVLSIFVALPVAAAEAPTPSDVAKSFKDIADKELPTIRRATEHECAVYTANIDKAEKDGAVSHGIRGTLVIATPTHNYAYGIQSCGLTDGTGSFYPLYFIQTANDEGCQISKEDYDVLYASAGLSVSSKLDEPLIQAAERVADRDTTACENAQLPHIRIHREGWKEPDGHKRFLGTHWE